MDDLKGKVALITGASRGIGRAVALQLARHGADICVNYRSRADLAEQVVAEAQQMGVRALAVQSDVAQAEECALLVATAMEELGNVDVLVNNAGIWHPAVIEEITPHELRSIVDTNLMGAFYVTGPVVKRMKEAGWGRIINMSSVIGVTGYPGDTMYSASKAGLFGFTKSLAREVARFGITVNAVVPGFITTDMQGEIGEEARQRILKTVPMRRWGKPEEVADLAAFLAMKGDYITGQLFTVDGGYTI